MCVSFIFRIYLCIIDSISNPHSITSFPGHRAARMSLAQLADAYAISAAPRARVVLDSALAATTTLAGGVPSWDGSHLWRDEF